MSLTRGALVTLVAALAWTGLRSWAQGGQVPIGNDCFLINDQGGEQRPDGWQGGGDHWGQHWHRLESVLIIALTIKSTKYTIIKTQYITISVPSVSLMIDDP